MPRTIGSTPAMWFDAITAAPSRDAGPGRRRACARLIARPRHDWMGARARATVRRGRSSEARSPGASGTRRCDSLHRTQLLDAVDDLVDRSPVVSTRDGVLGHARLGAVAAVALQRVRRLAAAARARARRGSASSHTFSSASRPHDVADVAALGDGVALRQERALGGAQRLAHRRAAAPRRDAARRPRRCAAPGRRAWRRQAAPRATASGLAAVAQHARASPRGTSRRCRAAGSRAAAPAACDRGLAGAGRAVDGTPSLALRTSAASAPSRSRKPGNETSMQLRRRRRARPPREYRPAIAPSIAMRWSPCGSTRAAAEARRHAADRASRRRSPRRGAPHGAERLGDGLDAVGLLDAQLLGAAHHRAAAGAAPRRARAAAARRSATARAPARPRWPTSSACRTSRSATGSPPAVVRRLNSADRARPSAPAPSAGRCGPG